MSGLVISSKHNNTSLKHPILALIRILLFKLLQSVVLLALALSFA